MIDLRLLTTDPSCKITKRDRRRTIALPIPWLTRSPGLLSRRALTGISRPQAVALGPALCSRKAGTLASKLEVKYAGSVPRRFALIFKGIFPSYRTIMNADYALGRPNAHKTCRFLERIDYCPALAELRASRHSAQLLARPHRRFRAAVVPQLTTTIGLLRCCSPHIADASRDRGTKRRCCNHDPDSSRQGGFRHGPSPNGSHQSSPAQPQYFATTGPSQWNL
jgi:hypothetical protein